ncbi:TonB-dependent receptor [Parvularcula marina]|uniref:TonB-dependent receptor n=1 Tax=Parvularcula marina TaxID=2292771 RepID=UPI0035150D82
MSNRQPGRGLRRTALLATASTLIMGAYAPAFAQDDADDDVVVVTGIRGSLMQSMDVKRESNGIVDAISAEDIGKFPDTNLAESLQRITGVSIDRVNGEGSLVTARGFGASFNLVTLNGRTMPTANVATVGGDQQADFATGSSRAFDFSNLASEGVSGLEVYKTGRAAIPSGGIGATVNISTARPLDNPGVRGTLSVKGVFDTSVEDGDELTPEIAGLYSWTNDNDTLGAAVFGSWQRRDSASVSATSNNWNINTGDFFLDTANGRINGSTVVTNPPAGDQLVSYPNDSRYHLAEATRERLNGQAVLQFRPQENFTATVDYTYAENKLEEQRTDQTNWFNRPFGEVIFDDNPVVGTTVYLQETLNGVKDIGFEQQFRGSKDTLESLGLNAEWEVSDRLTLSLDAHTSKAESGPDAPNGTSSTLVSMGAPVVAAHSLDIRSGFPVQRYTLDDMLRGNGNGVLDVGDLGSQIARTNTSFQGQDVDELRLDASWDLDEIGSKLDFGVNWRASEMTMRRTQTQQTLGDWGINNPGDVQQFAPGVVSEYCLSCLYDDFEAGDARIAFKANAVELYSLLSAAYAGMGNPVNDTGRDFNVVEEDIFAVYGQITWEGDIGGMPANLVAGVRYEETDVSALAEVAIPQNIIWQADNDFTIALTSDVQPVSDSGSYDNLLPSMDFSLEFRPDVIGRVSFSETLARPNFGDLFVADDANTPPRPTALGGIATGSSGNAGLLPLVSKNFDVSLEWYFDDASYVSIGYFDKRVRNFIGVGQTTQNLFGLRDPSSGAAGSRSGDALDALSGLGADPTDVNLFTMTALIDQFGLTDAVTMFSANFSGGSLDQAFVDATFGAYDVVPDANDPLFAFEVTGPINNREGNIHGIEAAVQHFFGDTGFGVAANYTMVEGDVGIDVGADPNVDQFALEGLSDSANATLIYEKYGLSARLAYNWRGDFLASTNRSGGNRNPVFVDEFEQLDLNITYDITDNLAVSFEGINLTGENLRTYSRDYSNFWFIQELEPRYLVGARYKF